MKRALTIALEIAGGAVLLVAALVGGGIAMFNAPGYQGEPSEHFDGKRFHNDPDDLRDAGDLWRWMRTQQRTPYPDHVDVTPGEDPDWRVEGDELRLYYVNHSTFLVQTAGVNLLTDPVWSERVGPLPLGGPRRVADPGLAFGQLPPIDVVLISHNHYDHLDLPTLKSLYERHEPTFVVPLGNARLLNRAGIGNVLECDWGDELPLAEALAVTCEPARHWSGRGIGDANNTLWASFVIEAAGSTIVFVGDSGYDAAFAGIGERHGPARLALLPIGAYEPRWFMGPAHMNPAEAVQVHGELRAARSVGHHFGTFQLADDGIDQPVEDLAAAVAEAGLDAGAFRTLDHGERLDVP